MGVIQVALLALFAFAVQTTRAQCTQCINRVRQVVPTRTYMTSQPIAQPCSCSPCSSTEDLNKLILLAKMLIERNSEQSAKNQINAEAIIKRLIDALIYTTLQYNSCRAVLDKVTGGGGGGSGGTGSGGSSGGNSSGRGDSGSGAGGNGKSLIDLGLLNPSSPNNVLDLGLAGRDLLGVGLGQQGSGSSSGSSNNGSSSTPNGGGSKGSGSTNPALIDLGLLRPNQPGNVLDLGLAGTNLLGVGLGGTGSSGSSGGSTPSSKGSGASSSQDALIDLGLLNSSSPSNVLKLDLGGTDVLGIGLGDPK